MHLLIEKENGTSPKLEGDHLREQRTNLFVIRKNHTAIEANSRASASNVDEAAKM